MLIVGVVVTIRSCRSVELRSRYAAPFSLLIGGVAFMVITGFGRADFSISSAETYASSRYIYIVAAMLMPAIAVAASQVILRWSRAWPFVIVILVLGIPGNIAVLHRNSHLHELDYYRQFILSLPRLPVASQLPRSVHPDPYFDRSITLGWLFDGVQSGRIPAPSPPPTQAEITYWNLQLAWQHGSPQSSGTCQSLSLPTSAHVENGTRMTINAAVGVAARYGADQKSKVVVLRGPAYPVTFVSHWPFDVTITPTVPGQSVTLCTTPR